MIFVTTQFTLGLGLSTKMRESKWRFIIGPKYIFYVLTLANQT